MSNTAILITPTGRANYCWLNRPDTTFNPEGTYQTNLILSKVEAKGICKDIKKAYDDSQIEHKKKNKKNLKAKLPYFENEDGDIEIKFSQKAVIHNKKTGESFKKKVAILDSKRKPCRANIGRDTEMKVAFEPKSYYHPQNGAGVTLRLKAVQIIKLVEYDAADEYAFEDEEGGFEGNNDEEDSPMNEENWDNDESEAGTEDDDEDEPF